MNHEKRWSLVLLASALACACEGEGQKQLPHTLDETAPLALEDALLYVAQTDDDETHAMVVDIARKRPEVRTAALSQGAVRYYARPGAEGTSALVLTGGREAHLDDGEPVDAVDAEITLFTRAGLGARYPLPGRFEELSLSPDGRFAVAYARENDAFDPGRALAVVDFTKPAASAARIVNPDRPSALVPDAFVFAPAGHARRLVAGLADNRVVIFDLERPEVSATTVALTLASDGPTLKPREVLFTPGQLYVRADGSTSVLVLLLTDNPEKPLGFEITPLQFPLGSEVQDIELVGEGAAQRLVALAAGSLTMFDAQGVADPREPIELPGDFTAMLPFDGRSPFDDQASKRLLLHGAGSSRVGFLDVYMSNELIAQEADVLELGAQVKGVVPLLDRKMLVVTHQTGALSLVDLEARTVAPVATGDAPSTVVVDAARARLWVTTQGGTLGSIALDTLSGAEILLGDFARSLVLVPGTRPRAAVIHAADGGRVTLLDAARPSRDTAQELVGFLWSGLFD